MYILLSPFSGIGTPNLFGQLHASDHPRKKRQKQIKKQQKCLSQQYMSSCVIFVRRRKTNLVINQEDVHESHVVRILLRWYTPYMSNAYFPLEISFPTSYSQKGSVSVGHSCSRQKQYTKP